MFLDDVDERLVDILGHVILVAADIEVGPSFEPHPDLGGVLLHQVLDVDLRLVGFARPRQIELRQVTGLQPVLQLFPIEELPLLGTVAEEQPVVPFRPVYLPLLEVGSEGSDTGSRSDHDDVHIAVLRQHEGTGGRHEHRDVAGVEFGVVGEVDGAQATASAVMMLVADDGDGQLDFAGVGVR